MTFVKYHVACPLCNSSDAVSINDDGSAKCFSCGEFMPDFDSPVQDTVKKESSNVVYFSSDDYVGVVGALTDRGISEETAAKYGVRVTYDHDGNIAKHYYPYYNDKDLVAYKIRTIEGKGFKSQGSIQEGNLFGQQVFSKGGKYVTLVEGECDAMAAHEMTGSRWPVVSIKNGADSASGDIKKNLEFLESFDNVIICFDNDKPGKEAANKVAALFRPNKAKIMNIPEGYKDANDMLKANQHKKFVDCFWQAKTFTPSGIIRVSEKLDEWKDRSQKESIPYPWQGLNEKLFGMRKSELVTFTGGTGLGKSSITRELEHWLITHSKDRVGIIALEEDWKRTVDGIVSIEANDRLYLNEKRESYTQEDLNALFDKVIEKDRVFIHSHLGATDIDEIFAKLRYMIVGCECKWVVVDHLHMLVNVLTEGDERRGIDNLMNRLRSLVEETNVGLILVSHLRRATGDRGHEKGVTVSLSHLKGSQGIAQLSDCVIALERDQQAKDPVEANTTKVRVLKSRYTGDTGLACALQYNTETGRLFEVDSEDTFDNEELDF